MSDEEKINVEDSEHDEERTVDAEHAEGKSDDGHHSGGDDDGEGSTDLEGREVGGARSDSSSTDEANRKIDLLKDSMTVDLVAATAPVDDVESLVDEEFDHGKLGMLWCWDPGTGKIRKARDPEEWSENFASSRQVAATRVNTKSGSVDVSTVFLGIDHRMTGKGAPILWETMVFGGQFDGYCRRYAALPHARKGHEDVVEGVKSGLMRR